MEFMNNYGKKENIYTGKIRWPRSVHLQLRSGKHLDLADSQHELISLTEMVKRPAFLRLKQGNPTLAT
jgi:hypothetical protein